MTEEQREAKEAYELYAGALKWAYEHSDQAELAGGVEIEYWQAVLEGLEPQFDAAEDFFVHVWAEICPELTGDPDGYYDHRQRFGKD